MNNVTKSLAILSAALALGAVAFVFATPTTNNAYAVSAASASSRVTGDQALAAGGSTVFGDAAAAGAGPNVDCDALQTFTLIPPSASNTAFCR
jgi:hypothetical protein